MKKHIAIILLAVVISVAVVVAGFAYLLGGGQSATNPRLNLVAAENFWGDIARQIVGDTMDVASIISDPNIDPHLYESSVRDGKVVAEANIVIQNGKGYDDFMTKLIEASPNDKRVVITVGSDPSISSTNPHLWYNHASVLFAARAVASAASDVDAGNAKNYSQNLADFEQSLNGVQNAVETIKTEHGGASVLYTEPVAAYMLDAAGLQNKTPIGFAKAIEAGNEPSAADQSEVLRLLKSHQVAALIYNVQAESAVTQHLREVATQEGVPVVGITETLPAGDTYQQWQLRQLDALTLALNNREQ